MKKLILIVIALWIGSISMAQNKANTAYPFDPANQQQSGIQPAEIIERQFSDSKYYPGTCSGIICFWKTSLSILVHGWHTEQCSYSI